MSNDAAQLRQALDLYREGDLARAQMLLESLSFDALDPQLHVEAHYLLGLILARRGDALEAAQRFQACISLDPRFHPALDAWGNVLANLGDPRGAIEKYKRALAVADAGQSAHILFNYGNVLFKNGSVLKALARFREAFKRDPAAADAAYMAGLCFIRLKRALGARRWMRTALALQQDSARNHIGMGNAYALQQRHEDAIGCYEEALRLEPANVDAHYNFATALAARGQYAEAVRRCKAGLRLAPDAYILRAQQMWCLRQMGACDAALQAADGLRAALSRAPESDRKPEFADLLAANEAACQRALGRGQGARGKLLSFLRESPHAAPHSLAELRHTDARQLEAARKYEVTATVRLPGAAFDNDEEGPPKAYRRTYWVIARKPVDARRLARELEPADAEVRFAPDVSSVAVAADSEQGVVERTSAAALD